MKNQLSLIIEDDRDLAFLHARALEAAKFETEIIRDGRAAIERLADIQPGVVVLDLHLPHVSGENILRHIRADARLADTRVIIATAHPVMAENLWSVADLVLIKPVTFKQLRDAGVEISNTDRRLPPRLKQDTEAEVLEELIDRANQLAEQIFLWESTSEFAQALIETNRLTSSKIHDLSKIGVLLDLVSARELANLPPEIAASLRRHHQLCCLAYENLNELRHKIHPYRHFEPPDLGHQLANTIPLLQAPQISFEAPSAGLPVAIPEFKLQQIIYNLCWWLSLYQDGANLHVSVRESDDAASLIFAPARSGPFRLDVSTLLWSLTQHRPGPIYGYLAQKIAARYRGTLVTDQHQVTLNLPLSHTISSRPARARLEQIVAQQQLFLDTLTSLSSPLYIGDKAAELVDLMAGDLLTRIEAMLAATSTNAGRDRKDFPWPVLRRSLRFFRLLTLDLRKTHAFTPAPINLRSLLESIKPVLAHKIIDHEIRIESEVAKPVLNTDRTRLAQIFVNLALNALEAMPKAGLVKFRIRQSANYYIVEVSDTGPGIPSEHLPRIFDLYYSTKKPGRGIGLHNVRLYVQQLNGRIEVASRIGAGTIFTVRLPPSWETGYF